jgi:hypothetical protein
MSLTALASIAIVVYLAGRSTSKIERSAGSDSTTPVTLETKSHASVREAVRATHDPSVDAWDSEVVNSRIDAQLKRLCDYLSDCAAGAGSIPDGLIGPGISCSTLRPEPLQSVFRDNALEVWRSGSSEVAESPPHSGTNGFQDVSRLLVDPLLGSTDARFHIKTYRMDQSQTNRAVTQHHYSAAGVLPDGSVEQHATWRCEWVLADGLPPRLRSIDLQAYDSSTCSTPKSFFVRSGLSGHLSGCGTRQPAIRSWALKIISPCW